MTYADSRSPKSRAVLILVFLLFLNSFAPAFGQRTSSSAPLAPSVSPAAPPPNQVRTGPSKNEAAPGAGQDILQRESRVETQDHPNRSEPSTQSVEPPAATAPEPTTEFQDFATASTGHRLEIFGRSLFSHVPSTFAPVDRIPVTADYVIGPGDQVLVRAWGQIDIDAEVTVDRTGNIYLPKVGQIQVAGLKFSQLQEFMRSAIARVFKNFDLSVNLGQLRSIQVFVVGQAQRPGTYTVSSLSTLINALFASGGPSVKGSMRHIQLRRDSKVVTDFDLYDLLLNGDKSKDAVLLPGDVIFIPPVGSSVALDGSVNVPGIYELKGLATLKDVLQLAGGLSTVASGSKVLLERIEDHSTRVVKEMSLDDATATLRDGDLIRVLSISPKFENAVTLRGNVAGPGRYPWHPGMKVRDLIPNRDSLVTREYWNAQNAAVADWKANRQTTTSKEIRSIPDINWNYALVQRMSDTDLSTHLIPFNLGKAIDDANGSDNLELLAGDIITIFSQADLRVPQEAQAKYVYLEGEFKTAGLYRVHASETLRQLVERVGLTPQAYLFGSEFTRESTRIEQQAQLQDIVRQMQREYQSNLVRASARLTGDALVAQRAPLDVQRSLIDKLVQLKPTGRIVLQIKPDDNSAAAFPDMILQDGDRLYVPSRQATISVLGEVVNNATFLYDPEKLLGAYLRQAGGPTRYADRSDMFLLRANGSVLPKQARRAMWAGNFENIRLLPGDSIVVPQEFPKAGLTENLRTWTQILSQFALGVAAVRVLGKP